MEILKRIGCRVLMPLLLAAGGLFMIVVVPMNGSQFLAEEEAEVQGSEIELNTENNQQKGLIYLNVKQNIEQVSPDTGMSQRLHSR